MIKYRKKIINDEISNRLKEIFEYIAPSYKITLLEWNHDKDHVHILFKTHPKTPLTTFINAYKSASSRLIKKEFIELKEKLWKENFRSKSFCLMTAGDVSLDILKKYIETQGEVE